MLLSRQGLAVRAVENVEPIVLYYDAGSSSNSSGNPSSGSGSGSRSQAAPNPTEAMPPVMAKAPVVHAPDPI